MTVVLGASQRGQTRGASLEKNGRLSVACGGLRSAHSWASASLLYIPRPAVPAPAKGQNLIVSAAGLHALPQPELWGIDPPCGHYGPVMGHIWAQALAALSPGLAGEGEEEGRKAKKGGG